MRIRASILAKILFWFFGNLVVITAIAMVLFPARIGVGAYDILEAQTRQRVVTLARLLAASLEKVEASEWSAKLGEMREAYDVDLLLFAPWGEPIAVAEPRPVVPEVVSRRLLEIQFGPRGPRGRGPRADGMAGRMREGSAKDFDAPEAAPSEADGSSADPPRDMEPALEAEGRAPFGYPPPEPGETGRGNPARRGRRAFESGEPYFSMRAGDPPANWAGLVLPLTDMPGRPPHPFKLLIRSRLDADNGLFFDVSPWLYLALTLAVVSVLWWLPLVRHITRPLRSMSEATGQIARGRFDVRVDERRRDEIGSLGASINAMADRLDGYVTGQKRFLGDIAHELGSPIGRAQMALGIVEQRCDPNVRERVVDAMEDLSQLAGLVNELLSFTRAEINPERVRREAVVLRAVIDAIVGRECPPDWERIVDVPDGLTVLADEGLLSRALANVVRNAARYAAPPLEIRARSEDEGVELVVRDHGPGVPEAALPHLFEPFFRPDVSRSSDTGGVGLGLAIVKTCVSACGGDVSAASAHPGFAVRIRLDNA